MFFRCINAENSSNKLKKNKIYFGHIADFTIPARDNNGGFYWKEAVLLLGIGQPFYIDRFVKLLKLNENIIVL